MPDATSLRSSPLVRGVAAGPQRRPALVRGVASLVGLAVVVLPACGDGQLGERPPTVAQPPPATTAGPAPATASPPRVPAPPPAALPAPDAPLPRTPRALGGDLAATTAALRAAIDRWRSAGDPARDPAPEDVRLLALRQQRIHLRLSRRPQLADAVLARLPPAAAREARDWVAARRALVSLSGPPRRRRFDAAPAQPAGVLLRHYRRAERRFGVPWEVLAAVNFVETAFGRLRSDSTAGAQGPMQFIPSTWEAYGMGGDVREPRDAIMGAANYLRASGAPGDLRAALHAYNPSGLYVDAVLRYRRTIDRDPRAYYALHQWPLVVRTPEGTRRLTGPGRAIP